MSEVLCFCELESHVGEVSVGMGSLTLADSRRSPVLLPDVGTWRTVQATADRMVTVDPSLNRKRISYEETFAQSLLTIDVIIDADWYLHNTTVIRGAISRRYSSPADTNGELVGKPKSSPLERRG